MRVVLVLAAAALLAAPAPAAHGHRLPVLAIDVRGPIADEPKRSARLRVLDAHGRTVLRSRIGIEVRGEGSQAYRKKQFDMETRTRGGDNRNVALLGLPKGNDWVLRAAPVDPTLLRDALALRTARATGRYAPRSRHVEIRLNGRYHGLYVLLEEPRLDRQRVDAEALLELSVPERLDRDDEQFVLPVTGRHVRIADANDGVDMDAVAAHVQEFERALYTPGGDWRSRLDVPAAVDHLLLQELFRNQDAFVSSTYLHVDGATSPIVLGPAWDFDLSAGNVSRPGEDAVEGWRLDDQPWAERLYADPGFRMAMAARWRQWRTSGVLDALQRAAARSGARLDRHAARNHRYWRVFGRPAFSGQETFTTHGDAVRALRRWLERRAAWMDGALAG